MPTYSAEFKDKIIAKLLVPGAPSMPQLSKQLGIPYQTIYNWVTMKKKSINKNGAATTLPLHSSGLSPKNWSAEAKMQAVFETSKMSTDEKGAYCRENGLYTHNLDEWKQGCLEGVKNAIKIENSKEYQKLLKDFKSLKSDLNRKDKALAETSALLILKKKANLLWGDPEED